jgi:hypothetical protein
MREATIRAVQAFHMVCVLEQALWTARANLEQAVEEAVPEDEPEYTAAIELLKRISGGEPRIKGTVCRSVNPEYGSTVAGVVEQFCGSDKAPVCFREKGHAGLCMDPCGGTWEGENFTENAIDERTACPVLTRQGYCGDVSPVNGYKCQLPKHHDGDHASDTVQVTWRNEGLRTPPDYGAAKSCNNLKPGTGKRSRCTLPSGHAGDHEDARSRWKNNAKS